MVTGIEARTGARDLGAPEVAHVGREEDRGVLSEVERAEELCIFCVVLEGVELGV